MSDALDTTSRVAVLGCCELFADAVGSVRPVVARIIRDLRTEGLISTTSDGIAILKPHELHAASWSRDV